MRVRNILLRTPWTTAATLADSAAGARPALCTVAVMSVRGTTARGDVRSEQAGHGGAGQAAALQPRPQQGPPARHPPGDGAGRPAQLLPGLRVRHPFQAAQDQRQAILLRQLRQLLVQDAGVVVRQRRLCWFRHVAAHLFVLRAARAQGACSRPRRRATPYNQFANSSLRRIDAALRTRTRKVA